MALTIEQVARKVDALRKRAAGRDNRASKVLAVRQGRINEIFPDFFPEAVDINVVANFVDIVARDLSEVMAPLPAINCSASNMIDDKARQFADKRTRIASNYFVHSDLSAHMYTFADRYVTYGFAAFTVELDDEYSLPRIRVEDSYMSYPEFDRYERCVSFTKRYESTLGELIAMFPEHEAGLRGTTRDQKKESLDSIIQLYRYYDKEQSTIYVPSRGNYIISTAKNPIGKMMIIVAKRPSVDEEMRGQFDDVLGIQVLRNRFAMLAVEAADKAISAPLILPFDVQDMQFGADAVIRTNNPAGVRRVELQVPPAAFTEGQLLSQEMQTGARYPQGRTGNINASVITGQGVQALMGAFDTQVKSFQTIVSTTLRDVINVCFMVDEKAYDKKKTIRGVDAGSPYAIDYIPSKDIAGDYTAEVRYGMLAGLNPAQGLVFMLQALQAKLISKDMAMRELPFNVDVTTEQEKIEVEDMRQSLLGAVEALTQSIPQMTAQGGDPTEVVRKIAQVIQDRKGGKALEDTILSSFAPPPPPPQSADATTAPGAPAGAEQAPPDPNAPAQLGNAGAQITTPPPPTPDIQELISRMSSNGAASATSTTHRRMNP